MYLCFEIDDKRAAFPEESIVNFDENGFTVRSLVGARQGKDMAFVNMESFKGAVASFDQALKWVRRAPSKPKQGEPQRVAKPSGGPNSDVGDKLPETPSF